MDGRYTLKFKKDGGSVVDSFTQWGIVCAKVPFKAGGKTKDPAKRTWYDEQGDDVYMPDKLMFEAYDAEFELAYMGYETTTDPFNLSLAFTQVDAFKKWLSGNDSQDGSGAELSIYSPYSTIGRQGCYLIEISNESPEVHTRQEKGNIYCENVLTFKVKFRVTDPMTNITLT